MKDETMEPPREEEQIVSESEEGLAPPATAKPSPILFLFAAAFLVGMFTNMFREGSDAITITLASCSLLCLGVDVGKMIGRR